MAVGTIQRSVLTDIANAIRVQNGGTDTYLPSEMAAAVLALDGTKAGTPLQAVASTGTGVISDSVFDGIADAIRAQNGLTETYTPSEMAPAILALAWDVGVKMRAILLADGTLEFNYRDGRSSDVPGAVILDAWEVDPAGYGSASARPWDDVKLSVTRAVFDGDFSEGGLTNASYIFNGFSNLVEISGFEELSGVASFNQAFSSCDALETIYASGFVAAEGMSGSLCFYGCSRLVGGEGFVPGYSDGADHLAYGEEGVLTDPASDAREWLSCHLYADGEIVFTLDDEPEAGRALCLSGRMCATARYQAIGARAWEGAEVDVLKATFSADLSSLDFVNLNYWFYGDGELSEVVGLANLPAVREMRYAFCSCDSLVEIDLSGFPTGELEDVFYCFSGCGSLTTIWADADWALPAGCTGSDAFYNCTSLVGGAGTTYSSSRISATYMRIDGVGGAGYLTAKSS